MEKFNSANFARYNDFFSFFRMTNTNLNDRIYDMQGAV